MATSSAACAPIHRLPIELLLRILALSLPPPSFHSRTKGLRSLAIVSHSWTAPAQSLLWSHVTLTSLAATEALLASEILGTYGVRTLVDRIEGETEVRVRLRELLKCCGEGIQQFEMVEYGISPSAPPFDVAALAQPSMPNLTSLTLNSSHPLSTPPLHFALTHLSLSLRSYSSTLLLSLLTPNLTSLSLHLSTSSPHHSLLLTTFPLLAPTLLSLALTTYDTSSLLPLWDPLLRTCSSLKSFRFHPVGGQESACDGFLESVPRVRRVEWEGAAREVGWVKRMLEGREGVEEVGFVKEGGWEGGWEDEEGRELGRWCEGRGVVVEFC